MQLDEADGTNEAAKYHVVFFDKTASVARAWMDRDMVQKLTDPAAPPKAPPVFKNDGIKKRYQHARAMAEDAVSLPLIERIGTATNINICSFQQ